MSEKKLRALKADEIATLEASGSRCADWSAVTVADGFEATRVARCVFSGSVQLGRFTKTARLDGGAEVPTGVYDSTLLTEEYKGDFNRIKQNINTLIADISQVIQEIHRLSQAVQEGNLRTRSDPEMFGGGWQQLVIGVNAVLDAFVEPINTTAQYIDRISRGDIPGNITTEYRGDFNLIKNNLNLLID